MKKLLYLALFYCLAFTNLFALGRKDNIETSTESLESWQETVDISQNKAGKYNILITAEDLAGNQQEAGPYNLFIDPNSDLPVTRITNPLNNMRIPGNLNIVGTCIDDDAVDYVEISLDGEEPVRAEGKEFWSYYLDTKNLYEGAHILSVYGVDIYGVKGHAHTVVWHLDRNQPETKVLEPAQMGSLVSGKFKLNGIVTDGNGINRLSYSLDKGKTYQAVPLSFNKKEQSWNFSLTLDSKKMPDGPFVCWFKAEDLQGSIGIYTYLFFVDNTKPEIQYLNPTPDTYVNGKFSVSGLARDTNGLRSLKWKFGKETGDFQLVKGNPYWIKEFDITGVKTKNVEVSIIATDIAGNTTVQTRKILVDNQRDIPILSLTFPQNLAIEKGDRVMLAGLASDDDGIKEVWYSLDKGQANKLDSYGAFGVILKDLATGNHSVEVWPVDIYGTKGLSVKASFTVTGEKPKVFINPVTKPNREIHPEAGEKISATITSDAGLKKLVYRVTGFAETEVKIKQGVKDAKIELPITWGIPYGLVSAEVTATDLYDRSTTSSTQFYVTNLSIPRGVSPEFSEESLTASGDVVIPASGKIPASTGVASLSVGSLTVDEKPFENGMLIALSGPLAPKTEQINKNIEIFIDSSVAPVALMYSVADSASVKATVSKLPEGGGYKALIPLKAQLDATWTSFTAVASFKDSEDLKVSGVFCVIRPEPTSGVFDNEQVIWQSLPQDEAGNLLCFDGVKPTALYNGKTNLFASSVKLATPNTALSVQLDSNTITLNALEDGHYKNVSIIVTDTAGNTFTTEPASFIFDSAPPELNVETLERPLLLQYELPITGFAKDASGISAVEYSFDGGQSWIAFKNTSFTQKIDIVSLPDGKIELMVRATDKFGRQSFDWRTFTKDTTPPVVKPIIPESGAIVNGETLIAFDIQDSSSIVKAEYRAPGDRSETDATEWIPFELSSAPFTFVGTQEKPIESKMEFRFTDSAGNMAFIKDYPFTIDAVADRPVVEIHVPEDNEVIIKDFVISGVIYDDDEPAKIWYRIDKGEYTAVSIENSFSIPISLSSLTDNEHTISMYAEDIHGIRGDEVMRVIRVSLEEPKAEVVKPSFDTTNKGLLEISGTASDKNGIARVELSLDNGNSWNLATGTERWNYLFDTRVIQDGTHVVFVRVFDNYGISGLYSSLVNLDNTAPSIKLELPIDGSRSSSTLFIAGQTMDNISLDHVSVKISNIEISQPAIPKHLSEIPFANDLIISQGIDISALTEGFYNVEVRGFDRAGNITRVSRNFEVYRAQDRNRIEFLYPLTGEKAQGVFNVYGRAISEDPINNLMLYVDDVDVDVTQLSASGYFKFTVTPEMIEDGAHTLSIRALVSDDKIIYSEQHQILYQAEGPWITIDNFAMGDFAIDRPWLAGSTGYSLTEEEVLSLKAKGTTAEEKRLVREKSLDKVEISFDNGKTFVPVESGKRWRYRIETGDLAEGFHFIVVRAIMNNGEIAVTRSIIQLDKTKPSIKLISPSEGGLYNNELTFSGLSSDDIQLSNVTLALRKGDKSAYAVPSFIQGLYFDWHFWGATLYDLGIGLTFFDDNVKIQGQFGQFTQEQRNLFVNEPLRYGGTVVGVKLLANIAYIPLEFYFGPDFSWLTATGAVGANFSWFSDTQSGQPQILSCVLGQLEFPRITIPKRKFFRTFSLYTEAQFWFIPTDVDSGEVDINSIIPHITGGLRVNLF